MPGVTKWPSGHVLGLGALLLFEQRQKGFALRAKALGTSKVLCPFEVCPFALTSLVKAGFSFAEAKGLPSSPSHLASLNVGLEGIARDARDGSGEPDLVVECLFPLASTR